jgi:hypothetical protein
VDRYNIYFAYGPTKVEKEVHGTAINFVIVCMFILQINLLAYVTTQGSDLDPGELPAKSEAKGLKVFCVVGFCITAALFISQIFFNMCANFSPILYSVSNLANNICEEDCLIYLILFIVAHLSRRLESQPCKKWRCHFKHIKSQPTKSI